MNDKITKYYLVADTHFYHDRMQTYCNRPKGFNQLIINQWRSTISPQDIVFHLGDVTWGNQEQLIEIMEQLPGTKILIRGNHDRNHSNNWFIKTGFAVVVEKIQVSSIILSHFPALLSKEEIERDIINIHGHFHNNPAKGWEKELKKRITSNHYLLISEDINYMPISLETARRRKYLKNSKMLIDNKKEEN